MSKRIDFKGVIKPLRWDKDFVIVSRTFAQDRNISPFTKAVILDVQSRDESWETNAGAIIANYDVGRDKARAVLSEGQREGYVYGHAVRNAKGQADGTTYHISTCKRALRAFVVENGWETEQRYDEKLQALKNQAPVQGLKNQALVNQALENQELVSEGNERKDLTKGEKELKNPLTPKGGTVGATEDPPLKNTSTVGAASTVKSEVEPATSGARARFNRKEKSKKECHSTRLNLKTKPQKGSPLAAKRQANKLSDAETGYQAFCEAYKASVRAAGRTGGVAGLAQGRKAWLALDEGKRAERLRAIAGYEKHLKRPQNQFKQPQHISTFINSGWEDFAEAGQSQAAPDLVVTDDDKIRAVVWDLMSDLRKPDRIKRHGWLSFAAVKQAAPAIWAEALNRARADGWRPYGGELAALAA
jgi:hypothetical protein